MTRETTQQRLRPLTPGWIQPTCCTIPSARSFTQPWQLESFLWLLSSTWMLQSSLVRKIISFKTRLGLKNMEEGKSFDRFNMTEWIWPKNLNMTEKITPTNINLLNMTERVLFWSYSTVQVCRPNEFRALYYSCNISHLTSHVIYAHWFFFDNINPLWPVL